jgi:uncharacterized protein (DUF1015 family)
MAIVKPFKALRYNSEKTPVLEDVVVPPYDVISPAELAVMKKKSPYNYANLILSGDSSTYKKAAELLNQWREDQILISEKKPCLYFYEQIFQLDQYELFCQSVPEAIKKGGTLSRTGIFARIGLEDYASKIILPHEKTFPSHKADRYKLMEATNGNMEPVFLGYDSERFSGDEFRKIVLSKKPTAHYTDHFGVEHKLWAIDDELVSDAVEKTLAGLKFYILDGHHRYETALQFYKDHQSADAHLSHRYLLADICSFKQSGTIILPTHRLVKGLKISAEKALQDLKDDFEWSSATDLDDIEKKMLACPRAIYAVRVAGDKSSYRLLSLKADSRLAPQCKLDLDVLHGAVLPRLFNGAEPEIAYVKNILEWEARLDSSEFQLGFLVRPTKAQDVMTVAHESRRMPHKSTFFYPKIPSGLVINIFD